MNAISRRAVIRQSLNPIYLPFYDKLCELLPVEDGWAPYSGTRTFTSQQQLYDQGRTMPGHVVTEAQAGESAHNYGCASDWTQFSEDGVPTWFIKEDPIWKTYIDAVTKAGLRPGAEWGDVDHAELKISVSWPTILGSYKASGGMNGAYAAIQTALIVT